MQRDHGQQLARVIDLPDQHFFPDPLHELDLPQEVVAGESGGRVLACQTMLVHKVFVCLFGCRLMLLLFAFYE